jgi:hypothetical protein
MSLKQRIKKIEGLLMTKGINLKTGGKIIRIETIADIHRWAKDEIPPGADIVLSDRIKALFDELS